MGLTKEIEFSLSPEEAYTPEFITNYLQTLTQKEGFQHYSIQRRSLDARKTIRVRFKVALSNEIPSDSWKPNFPKRDPDKRVIIIGCGPAGMFAAIRCLERGLTPIILERGKDVQDRRIDLANINRKAIVNEDSNYCFGEGGAGTYSDGKLYTRSGKRGSIRKILEILHYHGGRDEILYESHPHIGTNKLPNLVKALRQTILDNGGEVLFNSKVNDIKVQGDSITQLKLSDGAIVKGQAFVLATGHSARDIYELLYANKIHVESKPFALGVRVEHPQPLIDSIQYRCGLDRGDYLPASSYALTYNIHSESKKRGVFSFCMCPGGFIVAAATAPGEIVVNGMSPSNRNSKYANSGIVVSVLPEDILEYERFGPLAGMYWQSSIEQAAIKEGSGVQAPAQRLVDFTKGKVSGSQPASSYKPGLYSTDFSDLLPLEFYQALSRGFRAFDRKMKGYFTNEAQAIGIESRTSSPVRIPRDKELRNHVQIKNLYPVGEGAGYAGGIVSAAMDGMNSMDPILA